MSSWPALLLTVLGATLAMAADAAGPAAPALRQTLVAKNGVRVDLPWSKNWEVRTQADIPDNTVSFTSKTDPSGFAVLVMPAHLLYYLLNGISFGVGLFLQHLIGPPIPDPTMSAYAEVGVKRWPPVPSNKRPSSWTAGDQ